MAKVFIKTAYGLSFAQVTEAVSCYGGSSYFDSEQSAFVALHSLADQPVCWSATHSFGGRVVRFLKGAEPLFLREDLGGGWYAVREGEASYLFASSATSGSSLEATLRSDGTWSLTLRVPVGDDGSPYEGAYWTQYHVALEGTDLQNFVGRYEEGVLAP